MPGLRSLRAGALCAALLATPLAAQQDPPRQDCCVHLYNTAVNLGWASSVLNHILVPGYRDDAARASAVADLRRAADHVVAATRACSEWNPVWRDRPGKDAWLHQQAAILERGGADRELQDRIRATYQWAEELATGVAGMPEQRFVVQGPSCEVGYFRLGWLFGYAVQTLRIARARHDQGERTWQAVVEDARGYLRTAASALDQYEMSPNHANIDRADAFTRVGRMIAAPAEQVRNMEADADSLWTLAQQAIASDCAVLAGRLDLPPTRGYCVLRRPDLYQPTPGPPTCFEFYLADANVQDQSRMASIGPTGCGATYFAWRQGWRPDPSYGGPFATWREADVAMTILSRYGQNFYGCGATPARRDSTPRPDQRPPEPPPPREEPRAGPVIAVNGSLDPAVVAWQVNKYNGNNFDAAFESSPVNLEIDPASGRASVNRQLVFHMMSFNRGIQVRDEVEFTYQLAPGTGTVERVSGEATFTALMKSNGAVTRQWNGTLPWRAERQADGSYWFHIENGVGGWYAPIRYLLR